MGVANMKLQILADSGLETLVEGGCSALADAHFHMAVGTGGGPSLPAECASIR